MVEHGTASSLADVGQKFLIFVQKSDSNTQAWELVDNRLTSFFGATLKIKMLDRTIGEDSPYFYISLQHCNIDKNSYHNFVYNYKEENYQCELYQGSRAYTYMPGKYGAENLFKNTGEFIAIGAHTQFDKNLWMCEQGQVTCYYESEVQITTQGLSNIYYTYRGVPGSVQAIAYPGTGCPWLTLSDDNKERYNKLEYWFVKHDMDATITIKVSNNGINADVWQSISFGSMQGIDPKSYTYPLFVAGGSSALFPDNFTYYHITPHLAAGNYYDLDIDNVGMCNSTLLYPTCFNGSDVSNFRVLCPDGIWRNIYGFIQNCKIYPQHLCGGGYVSQWYYAMEKPSSLSTGHTTTFCLGNKFNMVDTHYIHSQDEKRVSTPVHNIGVVLNHNTEDTQSTVLGNGVIGILPKLFWTWSRNMPSGEIEINDKKYLCVPNGWDNRLWFYQYAIGVVYYYYAPTLRDDFNSLINKNLENSFWHKLLIALD